VDTRGNGDLAAVAHRKVVDKDAVFVYVRPIG